MSDPTIAYRRRPDATPEGEVAALANVYRFILDTAARKNADGHSDSEGRCHVKRANDQSGITNHGFTKVRIQQ
jgi:hypothetical protein